jgi:hypothetical protein
MQIVAYAVSHLCCIESLLMLTVVYAVLFILGVFYAESHLLLSVVYAVCHLC